MHTTLSRQLQCCLSLAGLVLLATPASLSLDARDPGRPPVRDGLSPPVVAWSRAMADGDLAALARMHDAGTFAFPPDTTEVTGATAIMQGYAALFARYEVRVAVDEAHWIDVPPLVVSWGRTTLTLHPKAGGPDRVSHTRFTDAAVRVADGWRYLVDHASMPTGK